MANTSDLANATRKNSSAKQQFLEVYEREHATTMRVLRAFPPDRLDLRPHPKSKNARELAWVFVLDCMLGIAVYNNQFAQMMEAGAPPEAPESWDELLGTLEKAHADFGAVIRSTPDDELYETVQFVTAPKTVGEISRLDWLWFLVHDQIHHRGQFSIYLRMADGRVPSIYGPTADEPWM